MRDRSGVVLVAGGGELEALNVRNTAGLTSIRISAAFRRLAQLQGIEGRSAEMLRSAQVDVIVSDLGLDGESVGVLEPDVAAVKAFLDSRIADPTSITEIVDVSSMGRTTLITKFSQALGVGPMGYLEERRLLTAAERLRISIDSVAVIARSVGYTNHRYFANRFRKRFGCTPTEWRENH